MEGLQMRIHWTLINRDTVLRFLSILLLSAVCLVPGLGVSTVFSEPTNGAEKPDDITTIKGTCDFGGNMSTWSAKLKEKGDGAYDAVYLSSWNGQPLQYVGTIKTDLKTKISGTGKASGGGANGTFEFSGKYGGDGIAKCKYKEIGGSGRSGFLTAEMPK
jgi:hypothetical protein